LRPCIRVVVVGIAAASFQDHMIISSKTQEEKQSSWRHHSALQLGTANNVPTEQAD
jgi:hypothetical protein